MFTIEPGRSMFTIMLTCMLGTVVSFLDGTRSSKHPTKSDFVVLISPFCDNAGGHA